MSSRRLSFFDNMSDFWSDFDRSDLFERLWTAYGRALHTVQLSLYQDDFGKSLDYIWVNTKYKWFNYKLDSTTAIDSTSWLADETSLVSIPSLRDGITAWDYQYSEGVDYTTDSSSIIWIDESGPDTTSLWAPEVYINENRIANNFGVLVQEELPDSTEYLNAIKGMFYAYWYGPTIRNIRNGLNLFYGLPSCERDGVVYSVDSEKVTVKHGYGDYSEYSLDSTGTTSLEVGDTIQRFDPIFNTIEVFDYINHPKWWDSYALGMINENFEISEINEEARQAINNYTKYFTFGIKIDAEKYASMQDLDQGISIRFLNKIKPAFTHYKFLLYNNFYGGNGDQFSFDETIDIPETIDLTASFMFNYINLMGNIDGFEDNQQISYNDYQLEDKSVYNLDIDILGFYEEVEITSA